MILPKWADDRGRHSFYKSLFWGHYKNMVMLLIIFNAPITRSFIQKLPANIYYTFTGEQKKLCENG